jgi:glycolate oxidase iron-sulfur subunit
MRTEFTRDARLDPAIAEADGIIRSCVHCGFCQATCPTYVLLGDELDSPRGRIYLIKNMLETQSTPSADVVKHIDRCLSCLACVTTCPSGVDYMHLVDHARAYIEEHYRRPAVERLLRAMLAATLPYPPRLRIVLLLAQLGRPFAPLLSRWRTLRPLAAMIELSPRSVSRQGPAREARAVSSSRGRVALVQGCAEPVLRPEIGHAATRLLARLGYDVARAAGEGCCGALVHHLGREDNAIGAARRNVDAWTRERDTRGLDAIITTGAGCGTMIKDYPHLLGADPVYAARAAALSDCIEDISEFVGRHELPAITPRGLVVAYQSPCSLQHGQKVDTAPRQLLEAAGFQVRTPVEAHLCCGSAGTYNLLQPDMAARLGARKAAALTALAPDVVATGNIGCATQLAGRLGPPVVHTVELLDWATGGPRPPELDRHVNHFPNSALGLTRPQSETLCPTKP